MADKELVRAIRNEGVRALVDYRKARPRDTPDFHGAIMPGADLRDAPLRDADLRRAHLRDADLRGADLRLANLDGANLDNANLAGAVMFRTTLTNLELTRTRGLDKLVFEGPNDIGFSTILGVEDPLAREVLMKGCGLRDEVVAELMGCSYDPAAARTAFVCFIRRDGALAQEIINLLEDEGIKTWPYVIDTDDRDKAFREIVTHIRKQDWGVFIASKDALEHPQVDLQIERLIQASKLQPIAVDGFLSREWDHYMRNDVMQLRIVNYHDFESEEAKSQAQERLVRELKRGVTEHL